MKIQETTVVIKEFILNPHDARLIKNCLEYCIHRIKQHPEKNFGRFINRKHIESILKDLK